MGPFKVFYTGGEGINWALDHDLRHLARISAAFAEVVPLERAEIVHSVFWHGLAGIPPHRLAGKRVLASIADKPQIMFARPAWLTVRDRVDLWLCEYYESLRFVSACGLPCLRFPDPIDLAQFAPPPDRAAAVAALKDRLGIPRDRYLVGNFHRDSSGADLNLPKKQKGADVLLEVATLLHRRGLPVHFLLAGPRRHWIRNRFRERGIPYTFVGREIEADDLSENTLDLDRVADLYRGLDAYVIASRWEGAPNSVLECAASRTKVVSTPVGQAPDLLAADQLFRSAAEGARRLADDLERGALAARVDAAHEHVRRHNSDDAMAARLKFVYEQAVARATPAPSGPRAPAPRAGWRAWFARRAAATPVPGPAEARAAIARRAAKRGLLTFALWNDFRPPPYGGGNQFMIALEGALRRKGHRVARNDGAGADVHVLQSIWFDRAAFDRTREPGSAVLHRVDGPIRLYRGDDEKSDARCYAINAEIADVTVMQSGWSLKKTCDLGFAPVRPVLMWNACDDGIFNRDGRAAFDRARKTRLISTSWSDNPRKGRDTYKWLDEHLDWTRFEYTFVGRIRETFRNIRIVEPVDSATLAGLLKQHDIFVTASRNDPCSNALVEALSCGLPAVYFNDGGHPELVEFGGLGFREAAEIPGLLDRVVEHYESFQGNLWVDRIDELADRYVELARRVLGLG